MRICTAQQTITGHRGAIGGEPQAEERDIGTGETRPTLLYNGYAEAVGSMYTGREL